MKKPYIPFPLAPRFLTEYGMIFVLLILCIYFSLSTIKEQYPEGSAAADDVAQTISGMYEKNDTVLIIGKQTAEDAAFIENLSTTLEKAGYSSILTISGDPIIVRNRLEELSALGKPISAITTTEGYSRIVNQISRSITSFSDIKVIAPQSYTWPTFLLSANLMNIANQIVVIAVIAIGMTMVIITGGIDLSVGSLVAFSAVLTAWFIERLGGAGAGFFGMLGASFAAILFCGMVGAFSGMMVTKFKLPPFIATLGVMQIASGLAYIISQGKPVYKIPDSFTTLGRGVEPILSIPYAVILMVVLYAIAHILMSRTVLGRYIYAVGGNEEAARLSGVSVGGILVFVYIASGIMAGLGGVITASQLKSGAPTYGLSYELYVIAAVVVGGTSLSGGEGRIFGTLIGAFIIAVIQNGMNLMNVESYTQKVILGGVIILAVLLDRLKQKHLKGK
jgi:ribose transport system permease protein